MSDHQKIHPAPTPSAPLVPREFSRSDKGDPGPSPLRRTIPVAHLRPPPKIRRNCCYKCFCWVLLTVLLVVVTLTAIAGILYLVIDPKVPNYSVDRLRVSDFTLDVTLNAHVAFDVTVTARNPNKKVGIYYEDGSRLSVWYGDVRLCEGRLPRFYQGRRNATVVTVVLAGEERMGGAVVEALQEQQRTGAVPLGFRGDVPVRVELGGVKLWRMTFGVRCELVVNSLSISNLISIRTSSCKFKKLKLF